MALIRASLILLVAGTLFITLHTIEGFPHGAPPETCSDLAPDHHGAVSQQNPSPYVITPGKQSVSPGSKLKLMITSSTGTPFKGFVLQARTPGGSDAPMGQFTTFPQHTKTFPCAGGYQNSPNTVTHTKSSEKTSLEFEWEAPDYYDGSIVFMATMLQDFSTFWEGVKSVPISVSKRSVDNSSQSSGISTTKQPVTTLKTTTTPPSVPTEPTRKAPIKTDPFYDGCGYKKLCFGSPGGCIESKDCKAMVSCLVEGDRYEFDLKGQSTGYVAVGLSRDPKMGEDSVVECVHDSSGSGINSIKAYMSWNFGKKNRRLRVHDAITIKNASFVDGTIYCKFVRDAVSKVEGQYFNLTTDKYNLLVAAGSSGTENVGFHDITYAAAELSQSLADVSAVAAASNLLLRLHGAFMIAAWIGTAGIGILLARYFKQTWVGSQLCGKDQWFAWHRMFMLLTWSLTIAAFVLIFLELRDWSATATTNPHAILGCVTTALAFIQPFGAAFRPHPDSRRRPIFNWLHWLVGNVAHILGIVTIFFAKNLKKAELPDWMDWILVGYVAFHVAVHLILSIASIVSERNNGKRVNSFPMKEMTSSRSPLHSPERKQDSPHSGFRKFMLAIYLLVIIIIVAALIIITVCAPIEKSWETFQNSFKQSQNSTGQ